MILGPWRQTVEEAARDALNRGVATGDPAQSDELNWRFEGRIESSSVAAFGRNATG